MKWVRMISRVRSHTVKMKRYEFQYFNFLIKFRIKITFSPLLKIFLMYPVFSEGVHMVVYKHTEDYVIKSKKNVSIKGRPWRR